MDPSSRAPKQTGDFGEGLVTYLLIREGYEVAVVDHVGADLIAQKGKNRYAVSVKTRRFRERPKENRAIVVEREDLRKLEHFAKRFDLLSIFAQVLCVDADRLIHVFLTTPEVIRKRLKKAKTRFRWNINKQSDLAALKSIESISYACLREEERHVSLDVTR